MNATHSLTWRGRLFAILIGMILLAVASEVSLRLLMANWREYHSGRFIEITRVPGYGLTSLGVPGFDGWFSQNNGDFRVRVRINEFGLRNDESISAAGGRIWVIGDSMSFGWGVERNMAYTQVLADRLGLPAYNVATPGSNVCGWQALYARMPRTAKPAAVVVGLTIENRMGIFDCAAAAQAPAARSADPALTVSLMEIKLFLTQHLALYNFMAVSLKRIGFVQNALTAVGVINAPHELALGGQDPEKVTEMAASTANELHRLRIQAPPDRPFLVALFPARLDIRDDNEHFRRTRTEIAKSLAEQGIATLDLYPDFKAVGMQSTHFPHDGHWNELGHRIAGEAIARWLSANLGPMQPGHPGN